jgi:hypothetical protein
VIGEPWFLLLTLETVLNLDLYWNKCTLYIKIETIFNIAICTVHYLLRLHKAFSFCYVSKLRSFVIGSAQDRSMIAKVRNVIHSG